MENILAHVLQKEISEDDIITMMVGREITSLYPQEPHEIGKEIFAVLENLIAWHATNTHIKRVDNAKFSLKHGEILGVAEACWFRSYGNGPMYFWFLSW